VVVVLGTELPRRRGVLARLTRAAIDWPRATYSRDPDVASYCMFSVVRRWSPDPVLRLQVQFDGSEQTLDESAPSGVGRWLLELDGDRLVRAERDRRSRWTRLTSA